MDCSRGSKTAHPSDPSGTDTPDAHGSLTLRNPTQTHSAQARTTLAAPHRRHELLTNRAAPTITRGIFELHGVAPSDVGAQLAGGCEDRQELSHGALHRGLRGNLLGNRAQTRRCRHDRSGSRLLGKANFDDRGGRQRRKGGRDGDFIGGASSDSSTDSVAPGVLRASANFATGTPTRIPKSPEASATSRAVGRTSDPSWPSEQISTVTGHARFAVSSSGVARRVLLYQLLNARD